MPERPTPSLGVVPLDVVLLRNETEIGSIVTFTESNEVYRNFSRYLIDHVI